MYCRNCGKQIEDGVVFCCSCGSRQDVPAQGQQFKKSLGKRCPKCGQHSVQYQTVTESKKTGCFTVIFYMLLALTILGLLVVIPLMLRKKTNTVTYAICQNCGHRWKV